MLQSLGTVAERADAQIRIPEVENGISMTIVISFCFYQLQTTETSVICV